MSWHAPVDCAAGLRAKLHTQGFVHVGNVLGQPALPVLRASFDRAITAAHASEYGLIVHDGWKAEPRLADELPSLARVAAALMDLDEVMLFQDLLIAKPAAGSLELSWHQDYSYWPLDGPTGITMWVALDDADPDTGCLHYVAGSHLGGERQASLGILADDDPRARLPPLDPARFATAVAARVSAGSAWVHHPLTWHMSPPNRSTRPRRAWSLTWVSPDTRWAPDHAPHPYTTMSPPEAGSPLSNTPRFGSTERRPGDRHPIDLIR